jgi:hypothetical protein
MVKPVTTRFDKRTIFTTLDGQEIRFEPFSWDEYQMSRTGLMAEYRARGEVLDCPQYTVKFASGASQKFDHDAKSILQPPPGTEPEDVDRIVAEQQETWRLYLDAQRRFNAEDQEVLTEFIYTDSLGHITLPEDTAWETRQTKRRIQIPTDPEEKRRHYINTVLLKGRSDQVDICSTIWAVSMGVVKEADLDTVKASFRDKVWGRGIQQFFRWYATSQVEDTENGQLDEQPSTIPDTGAERVEINEG